MRFSVLMPVYNRSHLVSQAILSILDQTFKDFEFIIIDDGSNDNTWEIIKKFEIKDNRIKPIRIKHQGVCGALLEGHKKIQGEIIVKQDSDDLSLPNRLEVIDKYFKENPQIDFFYHSMYVNLGYDEDANLLRREYFKALPIDRKRILKEQYIPGCFAYTKKFSQEVPYRKTHCNDDWLLILDAVFKNKNIGFKDEGLYEYVLRLDSNSIIHEDGYSYEEDEIFMKKVLEREYGIKGFKYPSRK